MGISLGNGHISRKCAYGLICIAYRQEQNTELNSSKTWVIWLLISKFAQVWVQIAVWDVDTAVCHESLVWMRWELDSLYSWEYQCKERGPVKLVTAEIHGLNEAAHQFNSQNNNSTWILWAQTLQPKQSRKCCLVYAVKDTKTFSVACSSFPIPFLLSLVCVC